MWHTSNFILSLRVDLLTQRHITHSPPQKCLISIVKVVCTKIDCAYMFIIDVVDKGISDIDVIDKGLS